MTEEKTEPDEREEVMTDRMMQNVAAKEQATLDDPSTEFFIPTSPVKDVDDDGDDNIDIQQRQQGEVDEDEEPYAWARVFLEDLTQIMSVDASEMRQLMLEHCDGSVLVPSEALINKWMATNTDKCSNEEEDNNTIMDTNNNILIVATEEETTTVQQYNESCWEGKKNVTGQEDIPSFNQSTETSMDHDDDCRGNATSTQIKYYAGTLEVIVPSAEREALDKEYAWARSYFDQLMVDGHIGSTGKQIHYLMQQNCGTESVPRFSQVRKWLSAKRKKLGKSRVKFFPWARTYFNQLMDEGHFNLSARQIHNRIQLGNYGGEPLPTVGSVKKWFQAWRKEVGRSPPQKFEWARGYFDKLMENGYISSTGRDIYTRLQQNCGKEPIPTFRNVHLWLEAKRKKEKYWGESNESQKSPWYSDLSRILLEDGQVTHEQNKLAIERSRIVAAHSATYLHFPML